MKQIKFFKK